MSISRRFDLLFFCPSRTMHYNPPEDEAPSIAGQSLVHIWTKARPYYGLKSILPGVGRRLRCHARVPI